MKKQVNRKMDNSPLENKGEFIPKKPVTIYTNKAVVIKAHDGLEIGHVVTGSTPEIILMMVERGFWRYATSED